jgi:hypothetical protein
MQAVISMTNFTNYQGELDVSGRLIAPTGTQQTIGTLQTAEQSRCTTEQTGSSAPAKGADASHEHTRRLPIAG